jgi:hypothetical protein
MNLSRFISVMKFRPLVFRNTRMCLVHIACDSRFSRWKLTSMGLGCSDPYLLGDRLQDLTPPHLIAEDPR